ncbi:unnamed protein product [Lactuca saligna]|uniref:Uncharacterized protein n=1 Tax=Lactuca saligna TaxID=75948 RepID=A0AA35V223_LACSI|nr:unnamed protein product [Lactuca saligna]
MKTDCCPFSVPIWVFFSKHGVQIPLPEASLYSPPKGIFVIPITLFEAAKRLPSTDFFNLIIWEYRFSVRELTAIAINKIVGFELICRALGGLPNVPAFNYPRDKVYVDCAPTLFDADNELTDVLEKITINDEDWLDCFLSAGVEEVVSLEKALQGLFNGELLCRDVDLVEALPPLVSGRGIKATIGSDSATGIDEDLDL